MKKLILITSLSLTFFSACASSTPPVGVGNPVDDENLVCKSILPSENAAYLKLIDKYGKKAQTKEAISSLVDGLPRSEQGFQDLLDARGIRYFQANEIATPNHPEVAIKCGLENLLPPKCIWNNGIALLSIFEKIRELIPGPILFRNWWRPTCYNANVDGAKASDHLLAKSFDIDFQNPHDRAVAQKFLCEDLWKKGENIQVGIGCNSLHVGLQSPKGKRFWVYGSMKDCKVKSIDNCWDLN